MEVGRNLMFIQRRGEEKRWFALENMDFDEIKKRVGDCGAVAQSSNGSIYLHVYEGCVSGTLWPNQGEEYTAPSKPGFLFLKLTDGPNPTTPPSS